MTKYYPQSGGRKLKIVSASAKQSQSVINGAAITISTSASQYVMLTTLFGSSANTGAVDVEVGDRLVYDNKTLISEQETNPPTNRFAIGQGGRDGADTAIAPPIMGELGEDIVITNNSGSTFSIVYSYFIFEDSE